VRSRTVAWWSVVVVLVATIVVGLGVPAQASEQAHWTAGRFTARVPSAITSVSCPRWSNCTAVSDQGTTLRYLDRTWRSVRTADRDLGSLSSVSCPSTSFCVAVGGKVRAAEHRGRWDQVSAATFDQRAVSCPSTHWCLAVGRHGRATRYDGHRWHSAPSMPQGTDAASVSCTSRTFCMAVRRNGQVLRFNGDRWRFSTRNRDASDIACGSRRLCLTGGARDRTSRWNGHRWVVRGNQPPLEPVAYACAGPSWCEVRAIAFSRAWHDGWGPFRSTGLDPSSYGFGDPWPALTCPSADHCLAVVGHRVQVLRHRSWHDRSYPATGEQFFDTDLSCGAPGSCVTVGSGGSRVRSGGGWVDAPLPDGTEGQGRVSCPGGTFCKAVDIAGHVSTWDGQVWSHDSDIPLQNARLDCVSSTYCLAASPDGAVMTWDGNTWTTRAHTPFDADLEDYLWSVSCSGVDDCWAGDEHPVVTHFDGTEWSPEVTVGSSGDYEGINPVTTHCVSASFCMESDDYGNVARYNGTRWLPEQHLGPVADLDCATATSCTAVLRDGRVDRWNGSTWTMGRFAPLGYHATTIDLSCVDAQHCVAIDDLGTAYSRS